MLLTRANILLLFTIACHINGYAQIPQYSWTNYEPFASQAHAWFKSDNDRAQSIYYGQDFPGMPPGKVVNVYLRVGFDYPFNTLKDSPTYHNVSLSIGYTSDSSFLGIMGRDTFKTGLTVVHTDAIRIFAGADTEGKWMKFPCTRGNFIWNGTGNFVLEISHGPEGGFVKDGVVWTNSLAVPLRRILLGNKDSNWVFGGAASRFIMDLGFDIEAITGIDHPGNVISFGLFPNPVSDGQFNISLDIRQAVKQVSITVMDMTGRRRYTQICDENSNSFFKTVRVHDLAKGIYLVEVIADGERIVRTVVLQ